MHYAFLYLSLLGINFLGLNGFSMVFWQFNWEFLKEVVENFGEFHGVGLLRVLMPFLPFYVSS